MFTLLRSIWLLCQKGNEADLFTFVESDDRRAMECFRDKRKFKFVLFEKEVEEDET